MNLRPCKILKIDINIIMGHSVFIPALTLDKQFDTNS